MDVKLNCVMLIDDNEADNFFHERVISKSGVAQAVVCQQTGTSALVYLQNAIAGKNQIPDLIFLDINMPGMNGWEFLDEFKKLKTEIRQSITIVMLSTSENPEDFIRAKSIELLADFKSKPLTKEKFIETLTHLN